MCGICGIYSIGDRPIDGELLRQMTNSIAHRGPDGAGTHLAKRVGLGHRRLSIIDLEGGAQPLTNEDASVHVVFNGEIYNFVELKVELENLGHRFKTRSDTEVIVHAYEQWGTDCVRHFNGMFAFCVWDEREQLVFLARDHLGVKPLYYCVRDGQLLFASEVKALLKCPEVRRSVDVTALGELFTFRFVPAPRTLFAGVSKLPAGHFMIADRAGVRTSRYWHWVPTQRRRESKNDLLDEYRTLLDDAVGLQLRSDVPVGLFLSSGVDSGCLLALMRRRLSGPIHTFTIGFEGGERTNETEDARAVAQQFDSTHHEMIIGPADYERYFERYLWDLEEPLGNESAVAFYFVSELAARQVKVALTGQGADEPWAGYHRYLGLQLSDTYRRIPSWLRNSLIRPLVRALPGNERLKRGVASLDEEDVLTRLAKIYSFFTSDLRSQLFKGGLVDRVAFANYDAKTAIAHLQHDVRGLDTVSQMLYIDTRASLPDDLLMVADKTSMSNSIEARVPFLDRRLVEFVESLPLEHKLKQCKGKYLHKKAIEAWLPPADVHRKKKGFANPVEAWLRGKLGTYVDRCLFDRDSCIAEFFDPKCVQRLVHQHQTGRENYMRHIYLLISFEMWHQRFIRTQ